MAKFTKTQQIIRNAPPEQRAQLGRVTGFRRFSNYMVGLDKYGRPLEGGAKFGAAVARTLNPLMFASTLTARNTARGTAVGAKNIKQANKAQLQAMKNKAEIALTIATLGGFGGAKAGVKAGAEAAKAAKGLAKGTEAIKGFKAGKEAYKASKLAAKAGTAAAEASVKADAATKTVGNLGDLAANPNLGKALDLGKSEPQTLFEWGSQAGKSELAAKFKVPEVKTYKVLDESLTTPLKPVEKIKTPSKFVKGLKELVSDKVGLTDDEMTLIDDFLVKRQSQPDDKFFDIAKEFAKENKTKLSDAALKRSQQALKAAWKKYQEENPDAAPIEGTTKIQEDRGSNVYDKGFNFNDPLQNDDMVNKYGLARKYATGGIVQGKSHAEGGEKAKLGDTNIEVEGGERIFSVKDTNAMDRDAEQGNYSALGKKYAAAKQQHDSRGSQTEFSKGGQFDYLEKTNMFESGGKKSKAIGYDSTGGTSYGTIQIASKKGAMGEFIKYLESKNDPKFTEIANELKKVKDWDTGSKTGEPVDAWKKVVDTYGDDLYRAEQSFADEKYTKPLIEWAEKTYGIPADKMTDSLKSTLASRAIQHGVGGAKRVITNAWGKDIKGRTEEQLVTDVYNEVGNNVNKYFSGSTQAVKDSIVKRMQLEPKIILTGVDLTDDEYVDLFGSKDVTQEDIQKNILEREGITKTDKRKYQAYRAGQKYTDVFLEQYMRNKFKTFDSNSQAYKDWSKSSGYEENEGNLKRLKAYEKTIFKELKDLNQDPKEVSADKLSNTYLNLLGIEGKKNLTGQDILNQIDYKARELEYEQDKLYVERISERLPMLISQGELALQSLKQTEEYKNASPEEQIKIEENFGQQLKEYKALQKNVDDYNSTIKSATAYRDPKQRAQNVNVEAQDKFGDKFDRMGAAWSADRAGKDASVIRGNAKDNAANILAADAIKNFKSTFINVGSDFTISKADKDAFQTIEYTTEQSLKEKFRTEQVEARQDLADEIQRAEDKAFDEAENVIVEDVEDTKYDAETEEEIDTTLFSDAQVQEFLNRKDEQRAATGLAGIYEKFKGVDQVLQMTGMYAAYKSATEPVPEQRKSQQWQDYMATMKQRAQSGIDPETQTLFQRQAERTYASDVSSIGRMATSAQSALGALGQASRRKYAADMQMGAQDAQLREQHFGEYAKAVGVDENMTQQMWERNVYNEASRKRDLKAGLIGQAVKNVRDDIMYNQQYGDGSMYAQLMQESIKEKEEAQRSMKVSQLKTMYDAGYSAKEAVTALGGTYKTEEDE